MFMLMCFEFSTFNPVSFKIDFLFSRHIRNHVQKAAKAAEDEYDKQNTKKDSQYGKCLSLGVIDKCTLTFYLSNYLQ